MFLNEARRASRLSHPNIVSVVEVGADGSDLFIAMEYLKGQSLARVLSRVPGMRATPDSEAVLLRILSDALAGVHDAHEAQDFDGTPLRLVHRDLTPQNIFVTYEGTVKVLDFGIAKALANTMETRAGMTKGKIPFLAPEQLSTETKIDRRVDIYSMGCCLWQLIAGRHPFKGMTDIETIAMISSRGAPSIRAAVADVPAELERICTKATAFNPNDRYSDAAEFQSDLDKYIRTLGDAGSRDVGKLIFGLFAEESAKTQQVIEAALSRPLDPSAQIPAFSSSGAHPSSGPYVSDSQGGLGSEPSATTLAPVADHRRWWSVAMAVSVIALIAVGGLMLRAQATSSPPAAPAAGPVSWVHPARTAAAQPSAPVPTPTTAAPTAPAPTPTAKKTQRQIDDDNPFERK